jgi:hypothetical protein
MALRRARFFVLAVPVVCLLSFLVYNLPPVHDRLAWRVDDLRASIKYALNPPQEAVFIPQEGGNPTVQVTLPGTDAPSPTPTASPTLPGPTSTPPPTPIITPTPSPLPPAITLSRFAHVYQNYNNCGPATLAMALSYWNWPPDLDKYMPNADTRRPLQNVPAMYLKPNQEDKNVMPYEMETFIEEVTGLKAIVRVGGTTELLKRFIASGIPVMIEKGFEPDSKKGWMGHFEVLSGYDDGRGRFIAQDSYIQPDLPVPYEEITTYWRHFNNTYLVIYPPDRESDVFAILGSQADETYNYQYAAQRASDEIIQLTGRDQFFAWYNRGSNLAKLQDYTGAAAAYDEAFAIYPTIPEAKRPWRVLWYQTGPYFAYFYTGRYYDVINLATNTLEHIDKPAIEESFYWRAMAKAALGDIPGAVEDYRASLEWHPNFGPTLYQLQVLGVEP